MNLPATLGYGLAGAGTLVVSLAAAARGLREVREGREKERSLLQRWGRPSRAPWTWLSSLLVQVNPWEPTNNAWAWLIVAVSAGFVGVCLIAIAGFGLLSS